MFSVDLISRSLVESVDDERDLEVALVAASRALGFVATHVSGAGEPDGIGRFRDYPKARRSSRWKPSPRVIHRLWLISTSLV